MQTPAPGDKDIWECTAHRAGLAPSRRKVTVDGVGPEHIRQSGLPASKPDHNRSDRGSIMATAIVAARRHRLQTLSTDSDLVLELEDALLMIEERLLYLLQASRPGDSVEPEVWGYLFGLLAAPPRQRPRHRHPPRSASSRPARPRTSWRSGRCTTTSKPWRCRSSKR